MKAPASMVSANLARTALLSIWASCFLAQATVVTVLYLREWIEVDTFRSSLQALNAVYVTYMGAMIAFFFATRAPRIKVLAVPRLTFSLAVLCSAIWNLCMLAFVLPLLWGAGTIENAIAQVNFLAGLLSWLAAPAIGFFFANASAAITGGAKKPVTEGSKEDLGAEHQRGML